MRLSIVATLYRSAAHLREFCARLTTAARALTVEYEIVLVNDGSPDESRAVALALCAADPRIRLIDLSRNFGHHAAMWTGLRHTTGDWVFLIDSDLQEQPEWLERFVAEQQASAADVVYGVQATRGVSLADLGGQLFYKIFNALSDEPLPVNLMTVRLMSRRYVDALLQHTEVSIVIAGLWARTGFHQVPIKLSKAPRRLSTYTLVHRAKLLVNAVTSFSSKPLVFVFYLGAAIFAISALVASFLIVDWLRGRSMLGGWPSLIVSLWLLAGLTIFCQGVLGIYLAKVYQEVKHRPMALIRGCYPPNLGDAREPAPDPGGPPRGLLDPPGTHDRPRKAS